MRHFIIVIEKYTKNDDNQNINGLTKGHEKYFFKTMVDECCKYLQGANRDLRDEITFF